MAAETMKNCIRLGLVVPVIAERFAFGDIGEEKRNEKKKPEVRCGDLFFDFSLFTSHCYRLVAFPSALNCRDFA